MNSDDVNLTLYKMDGLIVLGSLVLIVVLVFIYLDRRLNEKS